MKGHPDNTGVSLFLPESSANWGKGLVNIVKLRGKGNPSSMKGRENEE